MTANTLDEIRDVLERHVPNPGIFDCAVPGLVLYRRNEQKQVTCSQGRNCVSIIAQGAKETVVGPRTYCYHAGQCLVSGLPSPGSFHAAEASREKPFLACSLDLDLQTLVDYGVNTSIARPEQNVEDGIFVIDAPQDILEAFLRLLKLLNKPEQVPFLAPLITREIHYLLMISPCGRSLSSLVSAGSRSNAVLRAVTWIKKNYRESVKVESLASMVYMSTSSFHRQFKQITGLSPLQFQKQVRLHEAQHLMLSNGMNVATAAYAVGYESSTQFVREYKRQFGDSPMRDVRNRAAAAGAEQLAAGRQCSMSASA